MKTSKGLVVCLAICAAVLTAVDPTYLAAAPPEGWRVSDPGFSVEALLGRGTAMWAAGSGESIAVSTDAGQHWQRKHQDPKGVLLLVLNFVDDKFGYAAGTGGKVLFTQDGGDTWSVQKLADESILQAAFGDAQHGVVRTLSALLSTTDGGKSWQPIAPANDPDWMKKYPATNDMAALDKNHLLVVVSQDRYGDGEYLWTGDGGATWSANYVPSNECRKVFVADGSYWSAGREVLGKDKPGGGYSAPMVLHSKDGITWEHQPMNWDVCHWNSCIACTPQGCFAGKSSFLEFLGGTDSLAKFPAHDGLSSQWAKSGNALCLLSRTTVECTTLEPVKKLDTQDDSPTWESHSFPAIGSLPKTNPQCIRCKLTSIYVSNTGNSGPVDVQISFVIEASGQVNDVAIQGSLPDDVISQVRSEVRSWFFEPLLKEGVPTSTVLGMHGRVLVMNPDKPPSPPPQGSLPPD